MTMIINFEKHFKNKKIFITGHSGFTGGWACVWLKAMGANVLGYSLPPNTTPSLFEILNLKNLIPTIFGDICDFELLENTLNKFKPDLILHLAAQPLVSESYQNPISTINSNVVGTANILEISRNIETLAGLLCITTDKVYKPKKNQENFVESDIIGGIDPYSASKSAAEIIIRSYANSFFNNQSVYPNIGIARGGNIIGGGDWSKDRLIPDYVRSIHNKSKLNLRAPNSIRPWQHVLDLLSGYFLILVNLIETKNKKLNAWNLGPQTIENYTVAQIVEIIGRIWEKPEINYVSNCIKETKLLTLNSNKARKKLLWTPSWNKEKSVINTADWYRNYYNNTNNSYESTLN